MTEKGNSYHVPSNLRYNRINWRGMVGQSLSNTWSIVSNGWLILRHCRSGQQSNILDIEQAWNIWSCVIWNAIAEPVPFEEPTLCHSCTQFCLAQQSHGLSLCCIVKGRHRNDPCAVLTVCTAANVVASYERILWDCKHAHFLTSLMNRDVVVPLCKADFTMCLPSRALS